MRSNVMPRAKLLGPFLVLVAISLPGGVRGETGEADRPLTREEMAQAHREVPDDPWIRVPKSRRITSPARVRVRNGLASVQVNVDSEGNNIVGDAANETSLAVDPTDPNRMSIGWRQFDTIASNFRQAGLGWTTDGGGSWTFPGVLTPGTFRSDPVLDHDAQGNFFYDSLGTPGGNFCTDTFKSTNGGQSWGLPVFSHGGDKQWMAVDRSGGLGDGHIYAMWTSFFGCVSGGEFNRSVDGGASFETPVNMPNEPQWGTIAVGSQGEVYVAGSGGAGFVVAKSTTAQNPGFPVSFDFSSPVNLGGNQRASSGPNPGGLLGQVWVAVAPPAGPSGGHVYVLASIDPPGADPLDIHFVRSTDGGVTWSAPVRVNDDPTDNGAWQWFGTMSVSPNGRIDAVWNDTRNDPGGFDSELTYAYSVDGGISWSANLAVSPTFDPHLGWPQQNKLGDYYDMVSDDGGAHVAYAATFNGEQDVYYLRIPNDFQIFADGFESGDLALWSAVVLP